MSALLVGALALSALATDLESAELRNTADTLARGEATIHPTLLSSFGVSDRIELKTGVVRLAQGPFVIVELGAISGDSLSLSVEPRAGMSWDATRMEAGGNARLTSNLGDHRMNLAAGAKYLRLMTVTVNTNQQQSRTDTGTFVSYESQGSYGGSLPTLSVPLHAGFDLVTSDQAAWRIHGTTDVGWMLQGAQFTTVGVNFNHASQKSFRWSAGIGAVRTTNPLLFMVDRQDWFYSLIPQSLLRQTITAAYPTAEIWWKI